MNKSGERNKSERCGFFKIKEIIKVIIYFVSFSLVIQDTYLIPPSALIASVE